MSKLIPANALPVLAETHIYRISVRSQIIYVTLLTFVFCTFASLPLVPVTVNITSFARIRPATEVTSIRSLVNGSVRESYIHENRSVKKGDILLTLESDLLNNKQLHLESRIADITAIIKDLETLLRRASTTSQWHTTLYQQAWHNYKQKLSDTEARYTKLKRDYYRNLKLYEQQVITTVEMEDFKFEMDHAQNELHLVKTSQHNQWEGELKGYQQELHDYESQLVQLLKEKKDLIIRSPISGSIQNTTGVYSGTMVFANQEIVSISPDAGMVVEAYVSPNDIGLIKKNMPVRYQVDAFNYNQWGLATGRILDIPHDVQMVNDQPVFKVKCALDKNYLQLKNGYKGYLQKGMTLQARFIVAQRSLWQLLYDKADNWFNPNLSE